MGCGEGVVFCREKRPSPDCHSKKLFFNNVRVIAVQTETIVRARRQLVDDFGGQDVVGIGKRNAGRIKADFDVSFLPAALRNGTSSHFPPKASKVGRLCSLK